MTIYQQALSEEIGSTNDEIVRLAGPGSDHDRGPPVRPGLLAEVGRTAGLGRTTGGDP
jgi:hypothetical protein